MVATSCFSIIRVIKMFRLMMDVLKLKQRFATDVLTERSGLLSELMGSLCFTG